MYSASSMSKPTFAAIGDFASFIIAGCTRRNEVEWMVAAPTGKTLYVINRGEKINANNSVGSLVDSDLIVAHSFNGPFSRNSLEPKNNNSTPMAVTKRALDLI